jgi:hypothetical protein
MKFSPVWKEPVGGISGSELVVDEKGFQPGRRVIRDFQWIACTDKIVMGELAIHFYKIGTVSNQLIICQYPAFIECQDKFIYVAYPRGYLKVRRKQSVVHSLFQDLEGVLNFSVHLI